MKSHNIINFGIFAHIDAGKTTLTERILFQEGKISSVGDIESGTTETDYLEEEILRGISIQSVVVRFDRYFQNSKYQLNMIDTPGHLDFEEQVEEVMHIIDLAVLLIDIRSMVQSQTEYLWSKFQKYNIPVIIFFNKIDEFDFEIEKNILNLRYNFGSNIFPAFFTKKNDMKKFESLFKADKTDEGVLFPFIEWSEKLSAEYLSNPQNIKEIAFAGLKEGFCNRKIFPVLAGSAKIGHGVSELLDLICFVDIKRGSSLNQTAALYLFKKQNHPIYGKIFYLKANRNVLKGERFFYLDKELSLEKLFLCNGSDLIEVEEVEENEIFAVIAKSDIPQKKYLTDTTSQINIENISNDRIFEKHFGVSIEPQSSPDSEKINNALVDLAWEDDSYYLSKDKDTLQTVLWGHGELHLEIAESKLSKKVGNIYTFGRLKVARYEKWKNVAEKHVFSHSILDGSRKSGELTVFLENSNDLKRSVFFEKNVPEEIQNPIRDGFEEIMSHGNFGEEILGVRLKVISFVLPNDFNYPALSLLKVAVISGLKSNIEGKTDLIGPLSSFEVVVPEFSLGKVLAELQKRSARILNVGEGDFQVCRVKGEVSTENLLGFAASLRNMTKGKGIIHSNVTFSALKHCVIEIK